MHDYFGCCLDSEVLYSRGLARRVLVQDHVLVVFKCIELVALMRSACILHSCTRSACRRLVASHAGGSLHACRSLRLHSLDRHASCSMRDRSLCMQLGAMHWHHWRGHALNRCAVVRLHRCAVMHLNRCAVMRVSLWERFGIVRQTRGVDIFGLVRVGVRRESDL